MVPYFLAFSWIDDRRHLFIKDETMYPELTPAPEDIRINTKIISPKVFAEIEEEHKGDSPVLNMEFDRT